MKCYVDLRELIPFAAHANYHTSGESQILHLYPAGGWPGGPSATHQHPRKTLRRKKTHACPAPFARLLRAGLERPFRRSVQERILRRVRRLLLSFSCPRERRDRERVEPLKRGSPPPSRRSAPAALRPAQKNMPKTLTRGFFPAACSPPNAPRLTKRLTRPPPSASSHTNGSRSQKRAGRPPPAAKW